MATDNNGNESSRQLSEQISLQDRMAQVDKITESPSKRAQKVWDYARLVSDKTGFTTWDLLCFTSEWLGIMVPVWPWLEDPAKNLARRVYYAHYYLTDVVLGEERKTQEDILKDEDKRDIEIENNNEPKTNEARTEIDL